MLCVCVRVFIFIFIFIYLFIFCFVPLKVVKVGLSFPQFFWLCIGVDSKLNLHDNTV